MTRVLVAVSLPRHPTTGNRFRASSETLALAIALASGAEVEIVHVSIGNRQEDLLTFAGFGDSSLVWIRSPDPASALARRAVETNVDAVLTGTRSAIGLGTGLLPYVIARSLRWPVLAGILEATPCSDGWRCKTSMCHGARAVWQTEGPFVGTVASPAVSPGIPRFATSRKVEIGVVEEEGLDLPKPDLTDAPRRSVALNAPGSPDHADRLRTILTATQALNSGRIIEGNPEELADVFLQEVKSHGLLRR